MLIILLREDSMSDNYVYRERRDIFKKRHVTEFRVKSMFAKTSESISFVYQKSYISKSSQKDLSRIK